MEGSAHDAAVFTFSAFGLDWAGVAGGGAGTVDDHPFAVLGGFPFERMLLRTAVFVPLRGVREVGLREERWPPGPQIGERHIGADASILKRHNVLGGAVGGVAGHLLWPDLSPKADAPEQVPQRHV